jgi:ectoine hydrolase
MSTTELARIDLPFTATEYAQRLRNVKARMGASGIDLLIVTDPANLYYLTGYDALSFYVPQYLLVHVDAPMPIWIGRLLDEPGAIITTWLARDHVIAYGEDYIQSETKHPVQFVMERLRERGWDKARVALEYSSWYLGAHAAHLFEDAFGVRHLLDGSLLINWVRAIKSPAELSYMKQAGRIVENAMRAGIDKVREGVRECDVAAEIARAQITGLPDACGQYTTSPPCVISGKRAVAPHLSWSERLLQRGEMTTIEIEGLRHRYDVTFSRSVFIGKPSAQMLKQVDGVIAGLGAALAAAKPGAACEDVEAAWRVEAAKYGLSKAARVGYSIGIAYPPDNGEDTMSLRPGDRNILKPGMTMHLIPGIYEPEYSILLSEPFYLTEKGAETFCHLDRKLFVH